MKKHLGPWESVFADWNQRLFPKIKILHFFQLLESRKQFCSSQIDQIAEIVSSPDFSRLELFSDNFFSKKAPNLKFVEAERSFSKKVQTSFFSFFKLAKISEIEFGFGKNVFSSSSEDDWLVWSLSLFSPMKVLDLILRASRGFGTGPI